MGRGEYETILTEGSAYGFRRYDDNVAVTIYMNNCEKPLPVESKGSIILSKNYDNGTISEYGYLVMKKK